MVGLIKFLSSRVCERVREGEGEIEIDRQIEREGERERERETGRALKDMNQRLQIS